MVPRRTQEVKTCLNGLPCVFAAGHDRHEDANDLVADELVNDASWPMSTSDAVA